MSTAERVAELLSERQLSQSALAKMMHITRQALSNKMTGIRSFTLRDMRALADIFEVSLDYISCRIDTPWPDPLEEKESK